MKLWMTALSLLLVLAPRAAAVSLFDVVQLTKAGYGGGHYGGGQGGVGHSGGGH